MMSIDRYTIKELALVSCLTICSLTMLASCLSTPQWQVRLISDDPAERIRAIRHFTNTGNTKFLPNLVACLEDEDVAKVLASELELESKSDESLLSTIKQSFSKLNESLAEIKTLSTEVKDVVALNKDRISEIVENATQANIHLKQGIKDIKTHPWKVLFKPSDAEKRELHIFNTAREFADAAAGLDDATSRLQSLLKAYDGQVAVDDPNLIKIYEALTTAAETFTKA